MKKKKGGWEADCCDEWCLCWSPVLAPLSILRLGFSSTRFAFTTLSLALMHGPRGPMGSKGSASHRPIAGQRPRRGSSRSQSDQRTRGGSRGLREPMVNVGKEEGGGGDVCARARARLRFFCVCARGRNCSKAEGEGVGESAHCSRTGSYRAWGGLVWFSLDTNASVSLTLRVEAAEKWFSEKPSPLPTAFRMGVYAQRGGGDESVRRRILCVAQLTGSYCRGNIITTKQCRLFSWKGRCWI